MYRKYKTVLLWINVSACIKCIVNYLLHFVLA